MARPDPPADVVLRARRGEVAAFEALVLHFQDQVHALAWRLTYDAELARDITQDVFLRAYERLDRYDPSQPFTPWFLRVATNLALNAREKARLRKTRSLDAPAGPGGERAAPEPADVGAQSVPEQAASREQRAAVRAAIAALPETYAGVVVLYYLEQLGVKEIAARLGLPEGTVKIRLHRARHLLRAKLERAGGAG